MSLISAFVNLVKHVEHEEASVHVCVDAFMTVPSHSVVSGL